jgi:hypothetical protein
MKYIQMQESIKKEAFINGRQRVSSKSTNKHVSCLLRKMLTLYSTLLDTLWSSLTSAASMLFENGSIFWLQFNGHISNHHSIQKSFFLSCGLTPLTSLNDHKRQGGYHVYHAKMVKLLVWSLAITVWSPILLGCWNLLTWVPWPPVCGFYALNWKGRGQWWNRPYLAT